MQIALGELQRLAGPDTRVTARAEILGVSESSPYRAWTGVWDSQDKTPDEALEDHSQRQAYQANHDGSKLSPMGWLLSGYDGIAREELNPLNLSIPHDKQIILYAAEDTTSPPYAVAGKTRINSDSNHSRGAYAWWVGDEGIKARINSRAPLQDGSIGIENMLGPAFELPNPKQKETLLSTCLAFTHGIQHIGEPWSELSDSDLIELNKAASYGNIKTLIGFSSELEESALDAYKYDLTLHSHGLLSDVRKGGFKRDLTMAFEEPEVFESFFGVLPTPPEFTNPHTQVGELFKGMMKFPLDELEEPPLDFYLTREVQRINKRTDVGPNWGILYNYYNLYKLDGLATKGEMNPILSYPRPGGPSAVPKGLPYQKYSLDSSPDTQHTNSAVTPLLDRFQLHIRVGTTAEMVDDVERYKIRFYLQPMLALWNPYNVKIKRTYPDIDQNDFYPQYRFSFEAAPELVISGEFDDGTAFEETVNVANAYMKGEGNNTYTQGVWAALAPPDLDFMPGEIRILSATAEAKGNFRENELDYGWQDSEGFFFDWPFAHSPKSYRDKYVADKPITIHSVIIKERNDDWFVGGSRGDKLSGAYWSLKHETPSDLNKNNANLVIQNACAMWKDPVYASKHPELELSPGTLEDGTIPPFLPSHTLNSNYIDIGTWLFHLRTTSEPNNGLRNLVDANPRALFSAPRWDGPALLALGAYQGGGEDQNGYLPPGSVPEPSFGDYSRYTGLNGPSISDASLGQSHIVLFDVPRFPLVSLGQFQHANLSRYNFEPAHLVGNSYANPRIPLESIVKTRFDNTYGLNLFDTAYMVNDRIFDEYFFSTVSPQMTEADYQALAKGEKSPYNTRLKFLPPTGATESGILDLENPSTLEAWGGRFMVEGSFNINSTSVNAWKAIFSSMDQAFLSIDVDHTDASTLTLTDPDGVYVSRTNLPIFEEGYTADADDENAFKAFFQGYRKFSDSELEALAQAMVEEVKSRGPFLSMSDFINRRLNSSNPEHPKRGALQAALDRTVNQSIHPQIAADARKIEGSIYTDTLSSQHSDSQASAHSGYVMQGDLLQPLAPILSPRSDTFIIRAYGSSETITGHSHQTWCEAVVQRFPEMTGTGNELSQESIQEFAAQSDALTNLVNQQFGRKFRIIAFRWLSEDEL
ncbi:hypothetical protein QEH52_02650 [Coraliomargarita sp. SDUM461003]|uniref:Uncharacterized protein n=1 Tax=Thalassobacterium maritimum TaxID=3041265 RepID=A0ABU1ATU0_9BACT|nr:hypothetical protein [Coraliomargarita sp. SDUM461003]MDQ8206392.1 hypothetical protein [Coraliomargarita sp. SDUM461003]